LGEPARKEVSRSRRHKTNKWVALIFVGILYKIQPVDGVLSNKTKTRKTTYTERTP
jgi:hypothetical protein